jgi:hypothetical protein
MDNPRHVNVRMQEATPPNVYNLTLRERLFHGVRAIRLNPVDDSKMYGRAGILAHPYMLGAIGQSNGCVSFSDYPEICRGRAPPTWTQRCAPLKARQRRH